MIFFHHPSSGLREAGFDSFQACFHAGGTLVDRNRQRDVLQLPPLPDGTRPYLKRFHDSGGWRARKKVEAEVRRIERFQAFDLPGPALAIHGWQEREAFILFTAPRRVRPLDAFLRETKGALKGKVILDLGRLLARVHGLGVRMPDLMARHVMVTPDGGLYFIDLARVRFQGRLAGSALDDLARLSATVEAGAASRTSRLRFLRQYGGDRARSLFTLVRKREKRARQRGRYPATRTVKEHRKGESRCTIASPFLAELDRLDLSFPEQFRSPGRGATLLRDIGVRRNFRIDAEGRVFFLKVHQERGRVRGFSMGRREWNSHLALERIGLSAPTPVAWGEGRGFSFFMSLFEPGVIAEELAPCWQNLSPSRRREICIDAARTVLRLHAAGFYHRDLYLSHLVVRDEGTSLIDLQRLEDNPLFPRHRRVKDLAALLYSSEDTLISRTDRLRFFRVYLGGGRLSPAARPLIRAVVAKARRIRSRQERGSG